MSRKKYHVRLTPQEKKRLCQIADSDSAEQIVMRAKVLLMADQNKHTDLEICNKLQIAKTTPYDIRKRYADGGIFRTLFDAPRSGRKRLLSATDELVVAMHHNVCIEDSWSVWSINLLHWNVCETIRPMSRTTVHNIIKRNPIPRGEDPCEILTELKGAGEFPEQWDRFL